MVSLTTTTGADEPLAGLVDRAARGDEAAFARIVRLHHADMTRVCFVVCGDADLAEEAVAAAWPIAWKRLGSLREPDRLRPWLVSVAANEARQLVRRRNRRNVVELAVAADGAAAAPDPGGRAADLDLAKPGAGKAEAIVVSFDPRRGLDPGYVIDTAGATLLQRRDDGGWTSTDPRSRGLPVIVYAGHQDDVYGIWAFDPAAGTDGRARPVTERPPLSPGNAAVNRSDFNAIALSPDGSTVAFIQSYCGTSCNGDLRVVPIGGGTSTLLDTSVSAASWLSFAPDGRSVLATLRGERLEPYVVPLDGSPPSPLSTVRTPPSSVVPAFVRWTGGSRLLAMPRRVGSELGPAPAYTLGEDGTGLVRLADATNGADFRPLP